jgi:hypothetical protein
MASTKITAITFSTQAKPCVAGQRCTDPDFVNPKALNFLYRIFIKELTRLIERFLRLRVHHFSRRYSTKYSIAKGLDDLTALN